MRTKKSLRLAHACALTRAAMDLFPSTVTDNLQFIGRGFILGCILWGAGEWAAVVARVMRAVGNGPE